MNICGYIRVSTAEQATRFSLPAQTELIEKYAKENGYNLVGIYADAGVSASKALHKRKALLQMIEDAERGKFEMIVFKDITRWSRSARDYWIIQNRLDACGVGWVAIEQPFLESISPTGKFQISVMLGISQLESDNTAQRIRFVNASRVVQGFPLSGAVPLGYKIGEIDGKKRIVKDEKTAPIVAALFDHFEKTQSASETARFLRDKFGFERSPANLRRNLLKPIYKGEYHGIENICEPYITPERFDNIQRLLSMRVYHAPVKQGGYIFTSLVVCAECGHIMTGRQTKNRWIYYRCPESVGLKRCPHNKLIRESAIENALLDGIEPAVENYRAELIAARPKDINAEIKSLQQKAERLKDLYIDGDISKDEYDRRRARILRDIDALKAEIQPDINRFDNLFAVGWRDMYAALTTPQKRTLWRSVIKKITVNNDGKITFDLL